MYYKCSDFLFCSFKIAQNMMTSFSNKIKEKIILHCVNSKTNTLNKKYTVAKISTKVKVTESTFIKNILLARNRTIPPVQMSLGELLPTNSPRDNSSSDNLR